MAEAKGDKVDGVALHEKFVSAFPGTRYLDDGHNDLEIVLKLKFQERLEAAGTIADVKSLVSEAYRAENAYISSVNKKQKDPEVQKANQRARETINNALKAVIEAANAQVGQQHKINWDKDIANSGPAK